MNDQVKNSDMDAFDDEGGGGGRTHFGELQLFLKRVALESGASYVIPGVRKPTWVDDERVEATSDFVWKGKRPDPDNRTAHIVMGITKQSQEGEKYTVYYDCLNGDKEFKSKVRPALKKVLGDGMQARLNGPAFFAQVQEVDSGESWTNAAGEVINKKCWVLEKLFATPQEMVAASDAFFAQFDNGGDVPDGYTAEGFEALRPTLLSLVSAGQTKEQVAAQFNIDVKYIK